jgi:oligopeptide transport system substrate-binding protein
MFPLYYRLFFGFFCLSVIFPLTSCKENFTTNSHLKIGNGSEPESLHPHQCSSIACLRILSATRTGLLSRGATNSDFVPGVAKKWTFNEKNNSYTFHLRPFYWSDGKKVLPDDFRNAWIKLVDPNTASPYANLLSAVHNFENIQKRDLPPDSLGVIVLNDSTFVVFLQNPQPYFLELCSFESLAPIRIEESYSEQIRITNGPYKLAKHKPYQYIRLIRNPFFNLQTIQLPDTLSFFAVDDINTEIAMFRANQLDWIHQIPSQRISFWKDKPEFFLSPKLGTYFFRFNMKDPHFKNPKVRLALNYAINREEIVQFITKSGELIAEGLVPPGINNYQSSGELSFNLALATKLWNEAKLEGDIPEIIEITYNHSEAHRKIAEAIGQMWHQAFGIQIKLSNVEWKTLLEKMSQLDYQVIRGSWIGDYNDPSTFLDIFHSSNPNNRSGFNSARYDSLQAQSQRTTHTEKRMEILQEMEKLLYLDPPIIPIYFYVNKELRKTHFNAPQNHILGLYNYTGLEMKDP